MSQHDERADDRPVASFLYKNHRGEIAGRTVTVHGLDYMVAPSFGYDPGWFLTGYCHDRKALRSFALNNMILPHAMPNGEWRLIRT